MSPRRRRVAVFLCFAGGAAAAGACRAPTQAEVIITTTAPCGELGDVAIVASGEQATAEARVADGYYAAQTNQCDQAQRIGSLVITPGGDRGAVVVIAPPRGKPLSECRPPKYEGCIIARRVFSFIDHVSLSIPVSLDVECRNVPCDAFTTCRKGSCYSAEVTCDTSGDCRGSGENPDGTLSPDASILVDGSPPNVDGSLTDGSKGDGSPGDGGSDAEKDAGVDSGDDGGIIVPPGPPPGTVTCSDGGGAAINCGGTQCMSPFGCCENVMAVDSLACTMPGSPPCTGGAAKGIRRYCCSDANCFFFADTPTCNAVNGNAGYCVK